MICGGTKNEVMIDAVKNVTRTQWKELKVFSLLMFLGSGFVMFCWPEVLQIASSHGLLLYWYSQDSLPPPPL